MSQTNLLTVNLDSHQTSPSFTEWKIKLDSLCHHQFGTTTENLPDMPYWYMYRENVDETLIIQRIQTVINHQKY